MQPGKRIQMKRLTRAEDSVDPTRRACVSPRLLIFWWRLASMQPVPKAGSVGPTRGGAL